MMERTQGPLIVTPSSRPEVEGMDYMVRSGDAPGGDTTVALVAERADAELFAASPDLLAALERIAGGHYTSVGYAQMVARAAIRRVTQ